MIVITLNKVPKSLRGDLTKWCQEVQTNIYVGSFSARIRDLLWQRIVENIGSGEATMIYNTNNELGYTFRTTRQDKKIIDADGIPLLMTLTNSQNTEIRHGFSNAYKFHKIKSFSKARRVQKNKHSMVVIDLETTGLDISKDKIISIGAVRQNKTKKIETFYELINCQTKVPNHIVELTGITNEILAKKGQSLEKVLSDFKKFVGDSMLIGYNVAFDINFLNRAFIEIGQGSLVNPIKDILPIVKKTKMFLDNYHLETVLAEYKIENAKPHNALSDAIATLKLANKLVEDQDLKL